MPILFLTIMTIAFSCSVMPSLLLPHTVLSISPPNSTER